MSDRSDLDISDFDPLLIGANNSEDTGISLTNDSVLNTINMAAQTPQAVTNVTNNYSNINVSTLYDGENYVAWNMEVEANLLDLGFKKTGVSTIDPKKNEFLSTDLADDLPNSNKAKSMLIRSVSNGKKHILAGADSLYNMLQAVKDDFALDCAQVQNRQFERIYSIQFSGKFADYFAKLDQEVARLRCAGGVCPDSQLVSIAALAIRRHSKVWKYVTDAGYSYSVLKNKLLLEDEPEDQAKDLPADASANKVTEDETAQLKKRLEEAEKQLASLNLAKSTGRGTGWRGRGRGSIPRRGRQQFGFQARQPYDNGSNGNGRGVLKCHNCNQPGHFARGCLASRNGRFVDNDNNVNCTSSDRRGMFVDNDLNKAHQSLYLSRCNAIEGTSGQPVMILDSGASEHFAGTNVRLDDATLLKEEYVKLADEKRVPVLCRGDLKLKGRKGPLTLKGVKQVRGMKNILLSAARVTEKGYTIVFNGNRAEIRADGGILMSFTKNGNGLYERPVEQPPEVHMLRGSAEHRNLGHPGDKLMNEMVKHYPAQFKGNGGLCEPCELGKKRMRPHFPSTIKTTRPLELVHIDISGPDPAPSYSGVKYFIVFVDDWTRHVKVYLLKNKDGGSVAQALEKYIYDMKVDSGYDLKCIRTDQAAELMGGPFMGVLIWHNVRATQSTAYDHQQN